LYKGTQQSFLSGSNTIHFLKIVSVLAIWQGCFSLLLSQKSAQNYFIEITIITYLKNSVSRKCGLPSLKA